MTERDPASPHDVVPPGGAGRERQNRIYRDGVSGLVPNIPTDPQTLEKAAADALPEKAFAYLAGGAGSEATMRANRAAFESWSIVPRVLRNVAERDLSTEIFGRRLPAPLALAPIGVLELAHEEADLAVARAAAATGVPFIFSNQASVPMEDTADVMGDAPRWFQLYWSTNDDLVASFVERAEKCGADAIAVTLDTTMLGWRPRDLNLGSLPFSQGQGIAQYTSDPVFARMVKQRIVSERVGKPDVKITRSTVKTLINMTHHYPGKFLPNLLSAQPRTAVETFLETYSRPSLTWDDIAKLREMTKLPILLKGVLHPDDARQAADLGVDGIVVSNHGGRQVDGSVASLAALPDVAEAAGGLTVVFDSGIRTGADIFKALALGADLVLIGRPYVWGLALEGERGVEDVIRNLIAEFDLTVGLSGLRSVEQITTDALREK
ncbi:lactate 2-monooxygenase [Hoyosella altamirensis]|uniref:Isopentenyl diphosphate isomerase/L-lactate dehydrogenase-like FMN-dependent dehydrogenase n=1 Tax=Hoyosella altamirensis TaxID=616997 RepID=A0A839RPZ5_9ACTN|nr:lactate 2-monooxygenase [Hoyosella altamirensis]MBB3038043.1 isopentenyl diphosphate isomerase/L-lactate dehydrogenase-like FMN-dependent dehydrogenase [Hoyosella altamirensis]